MHITLIKFNREKNFTFEPILNIFLSFQSTPKAPIVRCYSLPIQALAIGPPTVSPPLPRGSGGAASIGGVPAACAGAAPGHAHAGTVQGDATVGGL